MAVAVMESVDCGKPLKKQAYFARLSQLVEEHTQVLVVEADNVGSRQIAEIRLALRGKATLLMGKNTMIRTCLKQRLAAIPQLEALIPLVKLNVGLVFCVADAADVRRIILEHKVPAPAKQGSMAPVDVTIPPGPTGMDPGQTSFFQALQIATKIVKGQIEIQNEVQVIKAGTKVTASQAVLLQKLDIKPFSYGLKATTIYDNGTRYPSDVLDIEPKTIIDTVQSAIAQIAALSLAVSVPTKASVPHSIIAAFKRCCALGLQSEHVFDKLQALKDAIDNPTTQAAPAPAADAPAADKPKQAEPEPEEEEEDDDMGFGLFD